MRGGRQTVHHPSITARVAVTGLGSYPLSRVKNRLLGRTPFIVLSFWHARLRHRRASAKKCRAQLQKHMGMSTKDQFLDQQKSPSRRHQSQTPHETRRSPVGSWPRNADLPAGSAMAQRPSRRSRAVPNGVENAWSGWPGFDPRDPFSEGTLKELGGCEFFDPTKLPTRPDPNQSMLSLPIAAASASSSSFARRYAPSIVR